jgi:hypothetical protein
MGIAVDGLRRGGRDQAGYIDVQQPTATPGKSPPRSSPRGWLVALNAHLQNEVYERDGQTRSAYCGVGHVEFRRPAQQRRRRGERRLAR